MAKYETHFDNDGVRTGYTKKHEEGDCFVATVVYEDVNSSQIQMLREIRDDVLMKNSLGRTFVEFYYSGAGKRTARFVREHLPSAIPILRKGLDRIISRYCLNKP